MAYTPLPQLQFLSDTNPSLAYKSGVFVGVNNLATWYENDNLAFSDLSFWEGSAGHNLYLEFHQVVVNDWRAWSNGCDVDSRF